MERYLYRQGLIDRGGVTLRKLCWLCAAISMLSLVGWAMSLLWMFSVVFMTLMLIAVTFATLGLLLLREDFRALFTGLGETSPSDVLLPLYQWLSVALPVCCALAVTFGLTSVILAIVRRNRKSPVGTIVSVAFALLFILLSVWVFYSYPEFGLGTGGAV